MGINKMHHKVTQGRYRIQFKNMKFGNLFIPIFPAKRNMVPVGSCAHLGVHTCCSKSVITFVQANFIIFVTYTIGEKKHRVKFIS